MRKTVLACLLIVLGNSALGQDASAVENTKRGILKLYEDWNEARQQQDKAALQALFVDNFFWVHGFGYIDRKEEAIQDQLNTDSIQNIPPPDFSNMVVYSDVALLKGVTQLLRDAFRIHYREQLRDGSGCLSETNIYKRISSCPFGSGKHNSEEMKHLSGSSPDAIFNQAVKDWP